MEYLSFISPEIYALIILPLFIFISRILDVTLGTIRIIFISKGFKYFAPIIGFIEIMIWLLALRQLFQNFTNITYYLAYAGGFAMGTFIGICVDNKLLMGTVIIRIITRKGAFRLVEALKLKGFRVTSTNATGAKKKVKIIYIIIDRSDLPNVVETIKKYNPRAFYTVEDVKFVSKRVYPLRKPWYKRYYVNLLNFGRKGK
jgi:uncharacterized protein YebE (UPF0316 family)